MNHRRILPNCRIHAKQKVRIPGQALYIPVHDDPVPAELFLYVKGLACTSGTTVPYNVFSKTKRISNDPRIKTRTSLPDLIGRHGRLEYCAHTELSHGTGLSLTAEETPAASRLVRQEDKRWHVG